ncbi:MAG: HAD family hydrolase [Promethearchaeota archaeon]
MIKAITFDLWNTIFQNKSFSRIRLEFLTKFFRDLNLDYDIDQIEEVYDKSFKFLDYKDNGFNFRHIFIEERIVRMTNFLKIQISNIEIELIKENLEKAMLKDPPLLKKNVKKTLEILSKDYKIGLISNTGITPGYIISQIFQKYGILKYFQVTIFSDEIGYYKPYSLLFENALKKLQCKPEHSIHVGDLLHTDVKGAKDYGMRAIWFNDSDQSTIPEIQPDYEIKEMFEVIEIIKNI